MKKPFRSLVSTKVISWLLRSPVSGAVERSLVELGHRYPYSLPARGTIVWQMVQRKACKNVIAKLLNGIKVSVPPTKEGYSLYLAGCLMGEGERPTTNFLNRVLRDEDTFIDIGANLGFYTFLAAAICGRSGHVYAFEPQPNLVEHLLRSVALNKYEERVSIVQAAVTQNHGDEVKLFLSEDSLNNTGVASIFHHEWLGAKNVLTVSTISIDRYVHDNKIDWIDVMKIDIEGGEIFALRGMKETLLKMTPTAIVIELFPAVQPEQDPHCIRANSCAAKPLDVVNFLRDFGYELHRILPNGLLGTSYTDDVICELNTATNVAFTQPVLKKLRPEMFAP